MVAIEASISAHSQFNRHFELDCDDQIFLFFSEHKGNAKEALKVRVQRATHFLRTGIWINEKLLCAYAAAHPQQHVSSFFSGKRLERKVVRHELNMVIPKTSLWASCKKTFGFLNEYVHDSQTVGSLFPSSKYLAKEMVREIPKNLQAPRRRILEIGPGTGAFTDKIIKRMNPTDVLHLVEFDKKFCDQLREKYKHIPNVKVFHRSILDHNVSDGNRYNFVVSGLPLNSFPVETVGQIFKKFEELTAENGKLSYFDYLFLPRIKRLYLDDDERVSFDAILAQKKQFYEKYGVRMKNVKMNVFPARVLHHRLFSAVVENR